MTWALLPPKVLSKDSIIRKIVLGAKYVKPRIKNATVDHIANVHNVIQTRYGKGLQWILAGDTKDLKLGPIPRLNTKFQSIVSKPTRINIKNPSKSSKLDIIITDLHKWYQKPQCLLPIEPDIKCDKLSDHLTVVC